MRLAILPGFFTSLVMLSTAAAAAQIDRVVGSVMINKGSGYKQIASATSTKPGDVIIAGVDSRAELIYSDGCRVKIEPGVVVTVSDVSPCKATQAEGVTSGQLLVGGVLVAGGVALAIGLSNSGSSNRPKSP